MSQGPSPERRAELVARQRDAIDQVRQYAHKLYHNQVDAGVDPRTVSSEDQKQMRIADAYMLRHLCKPVETQ